MDELVIPWGPGKLQLMETAEKRGYRVYAGVDSKNAGGAVDAAVANGFAGIIVECDSEEPGQGTTRTLVQGLRRSHPQLTVLELDPGGKQPQMRGNLVVNRNGVLEVSSPTQQPWIDSNVALARFEGASQPEQAPLFSFSWDLIDPLERQEGPRSADYALAVAEAGAMHADVILPVHPNLQKALAAGNQAAWREWNRVKPYIKFYSKITARRAGSWADIAVVTDNYQDAYEAMNLFARHNIQFQVLRSGEVTAPRLRRLQVVIMFSRPQERTARSLQAFSSTGGVVVLVNLHGPFPWSALPAVKTSFGATYKVGRGEIVDFTEPVGDPEEFAETIRGLRKKQSVLVSLWNALTTLAFAYPEPHAGNLVLELVNYAQDPLKVQLRVKGSFSHIRYETPEHGFYAEIHPERGDGFTEFVVPQLRIGGRVYLSSEEKHPRYTSAHN